MSLYFASPCAKLDRILVRKFTILFSNLDRIREMDKLDHILGSQLRPTDATLDFPLKQTLGGIYGTTD